MTDRTARDRAWLSVIDALRGGEALTAQDVIDDADVSHPTARGVLHVAEDADLLERDSPRAHSYYPLLILSGDDLDDHSRRLLRDTLAVVRDSSHDSREENQTKNNHES